MRSRKSCTSSLEGLGEKISPGSRITSAVFPKAPQPDRKAGRKTGTKITFRPDTTIMEATKFNYDTLAQRLRELAFLNKGLKINLTDEREEPEKEHEFIYSGRHRGIHQAPEPRQVRSSRKSDLFRRREARAERQRSAMEIALNITTGIRKRCSVSPTTSTRSTGARI